MMSPATALVRSTTGVQAKCRLQPRQLDNDTPMVYRRFLIYFPKIGPTLFDHLSITSRGGGGWKYPIERFLIVDDHRVSYILYFIASKYSFYSLGMEIMGLIKR